MYVCMTIEVQHYASNTYKLLYAAAHYKYHHKCEIYSEIFSHTTHII